MTRRRASTAIAFSLNKLFLLSLFSSFALHITGCITSEQRDEDHYNDLATKLSPWIGKHRDERSKTVGPPTRCFMLETREEVCEWSEAGVEGESYYGTSAGYGSTSSWRHSMIFLYDSSHVAKSWSYNGSWGQFESGRKPRPVVSPRGSSSAEESQ